MKIGKYDLSIFVDPSERTFNVELPMIIPPYPINKNVLNSKEYILASLFKYLKSFYSLIKLARVETHIDEFLVFPKSFTVDTFLEVVTKIPYENRSILATWVEKIKKRYSLLENWDISLMMVILTHHLPVPEPVNAINYYLPVSSKESEVESEKSKTFAERLSSPSITRTWAVTSHPAIYFTSQTSPTSLIHWIEKNKGLFNIINKNLKKESTISSKMSVKTLRVGQACLFTAWGNITRWRDMEKTYLDWEKEGDDNYWGNDGVPTPEDFRISFKTYYSVMKKLESGNSESL